MPDYTVEDCACCNATVCPCSDLDCVYICFENLVADGPPDGEPYSYGNVCARFTASTGPGAKNWDGGTIASAGEAVYPVTASLSCTLGVYTLSLGIERCGPKSVTATLTPPCPDPISLTFPAMTNTCDVGHISFDSATLTPCPDTCGCCDGTLPDTLYVSGPVGSFTVTYIGGCIWQGTVVCGESTLLFTYGCNPQQFGAYCDGFSLTPFPGIASESCDPFEVVTDEYVLGCLDCDPPYTGCGLCSGTGAYTVTAYPPMSMLSLAAPTGPNDPGADARTRVKAASQAKWEADKAKVKANKSKPAPKKEGGCGCGKQAKKPEQITPEELEKRRLHQRMLSEAKKQGFSS